MFTIKFYSEDGCRQRIYEAQSFTILRAPKDSTGPGPAWTVDAEITLHQKSQGEDFRVDIGHDIKGNRPLLWPPLYQKAIIENASGRTTEIIVAVQEIPRD